MESKDFLEILENIYGALTYEDWCHAREYVKIQIERLKKENKKEEKILDLRQKQKE